VRPPTTVSDVSDGITKVEVSTDGGIAWNEAKITQAKGQWRWDTFEYLWNAAGSAMRISRVTDAVADATTQL